MWREKFFHSKSNERWRHFFSYGEGKEFSMLNQEKKWEKSFTLSTLFILRWCQAFMLVMTSTTYSSYSSNQNDNYLTLHHAVTNILALFSHSLSASVTIIIIITPNPHHLSLDHRRTWVTTDRWKSKRVKLAWKSLSSCREAKAKMLWLQQLRRFEG